LNEFSDFLLNLKRQSIEIFAGDININILETNSRIVNEYLAIAGRNGFTSYINGPTRVTEITSTCIDHYFVSACQNQSKCYGFILQNTITDHYTTLLRIVYTTKNTKNECASRLGVKTKINYDKLFTILGAKSWNTVLDCNDADTATTNFINTLNNCLGRCTMKRPFKQVNKLKPWMTLGIAISVNTKDKLKKTTY